MWLTEKHIRHFNLMNGNQASKNALSRFHAALKKDIASKRIDAHVPGGVECLDIEKRLAKGLAKMNGHTVELRFKPVPLPVEKAIQRSAKVLTLNGINNEADLIKTFTDSAAPFRFVKFDHQKYAAEFGVNGEIKTPIGIVTIDFDDLDKLEARFREKYFGLIKPTLTDPLLVVKHRERELFIKTFTDRKRGIIYFVTVAKNETGYFSLSSMHEKRDASILKKIREGTVTYQNSRIKTTALSGADTPPRNYVTLEIGIPYQEAKLSKNITKKQPAPKKVEPIKVESKVTVKRKSLGGLDASELRKMDFKTYSLTEVWKRDFHKLNSDTQIMVWGLPGSGKTVYLLKFAQYLAERLGLKTLYVANEEFGRSTMKEKLDTFNIGHANLRFERDIIDLSPFEAVFFDSINSTGMNLGEYKKLVRQYPNKLFVLIVQSTKDGDFRGGKDWEHEVDVAGEIVNRKLILRKNRLDPNNGQKADKLNTDAAIAEAKKKLEIRNAVKAQTEKPKIISK